MKASKLIDRLTKHDSVKDLYIRVGNFVIPCIWWTNKNIVSFYCSKIPPLRISAPPTREEIKEEIRKHITQYLNLEILTNERNGCVGLV